MIPSLGSFDRIEVGYSPNNVGHLFLIIEVGFQEGKWSEMSCLESVNSQDSKYMISSESIFKGDIIFVKLFIFGLCTWLTVLSILVCHERLSIRRMIKHSSHSLQHITDSFN